MKTASGVKHVVVVAVLALLLALPALAGCGDSPYQTAAKAIVDRLTAARVELEGKAERAAGEEPVSADAQLVAMAVMNEAATDMMAAIAEADTELRALIPPDAAAEAFQSAYLSALEDYTDNLQKLTETLDYFAACTEALKGAIPEGVESGVWAGIYDLTQGGVHQNNVAIAASLLETVEPVLAGSVQKWGAVTPLDGVEAEHAAMLTDLQRVHETFATMATLARSATDTGSESTLGELTLQWELSADRWDTLLADLDAWYNKTNGLGDSSTNTLDSIQKDLDDLGETL
jgi:hypothetical protein